MTCRRRWLLILSGLVVVLGVGFAALRLEFEGPELADKIATTLNKKMRGRIEIGSIEWPTGALQKALTGGWVPVTARNVKVWDDCALNTGASALDDIRLGDPNEDCTIDDRNDPDPSSHRKPRKLLLRTELITAEVDIHALMFGNHDFVFRNLWVHGGDALLEQTREPYPLHAYDRTIVSIITAFYPRMKAGFRAGIYADKPSPIFDLRDIHIKGVNLTVHMTPKTGSRDKTGYITTAWLEGVDVDAGETPSNDSYLYMDSIDPLVSKFYVRLTATARRGILRLWDDGPRDSFRLPNASEAFPIKGRDADYEIGLADIKLHRLAQLPGEWGRKDFVANTLELDLEANTLPCGAGSRANTGALGPDAAALHITGELHNYWDRPYDGSWNLALDGRNMGPTIHSCIKSKISGDQLDGTITLSGPFVASPKITLSMKNLDFDVPLGSDEKPLQLTLASVQGAIDLVNEQGSIDPSTALIRNGKEPGEVAVSATFQVTPFNARAQVEIVKAIDVGRFLPESARPVGTFLQGRLTAVGDSEIGFSLENFDLALGRTPNERSLRAHRGRLFTNDDFDTINIQRVEVDAGRSHAVADGKVDVVHPENNDILIDGNFPDLDTWLKRFGLPAFVTNAGGTTIRIRGPLTSPMVTLRAPNLGGVPCLDKVAVDAQFDSTTGLFELRHLTSGKFGGSLVGSALIRAGDKTKPTMIERLHLTGRALEASKICHLEGFAKGTIDVVDVDLAGSIDPERSAVDWLALAKVYGQSKRLTILGDRFTNVAACINRTDDAACRPRPGYLDGDDLQQCEQGKKHGFCAVATATRDGGGIVDATIANVVTTRGRATTAQLGGTVALSDVPIAILDQLLGVARPGQSGGVASLALHLTGSPTAPQADGALQLLRTWVAGSFLGDAQFAIAPAPQGKGLAITGTAMAGRLHVSGTIGTHAPYPVELAISGRRIELDVLLDVQNRLKVPFPTQAWVTGTVTVRTELVPTQRAEPEAWIELTELVGIVTYRSVDGRIVPLRVSAVDQDRSKRRAVSLHVTPTSIDFACRDPNAPSGRVDCTTRLELGAQAAAPAGVIDFKGHVTRQNMAIEAVGRLDLAPIGALLETKFAEVSGHIDIAASITGTFSKPSYQASLTLDNVQARPLGGDTILEAPSGLIELANGSLGFTSIKVRVRDPHRDAADAASRPRGAGRDEAGEISIKGNIALDGLVPKRWSVLIDGTLAGKMLLVVMPNLVSQASGLARIEGFVKLTGAGPRPDVSGALVFDPPPACAPRQRGKPPTAEPVGECRRRGELPRPITLTLRGVRRELAVTGGSIEIDTETVGDRRTYKATLQDVTATIDGDGAISDLDGYVELRDGAITQLSLRLDADNVPYRKDQIDLIASATGVTISKPNETANLDVHGSISIIDGTYRQDLEITDSIRQLASTAPPSIPVWDLYPTLGNTNLDLEIEVRKFVIKSNIASIDMAGDVVLTNTPRDPRMSGQIRVERGRFKLPGMRAEFKDTSGQISFNKDQPADNPELRVTSEADFRDLTGQDHAITLTIEGYIKALRWDLKTSTGLNKSQTVSLLLLGRNPEQLRLSLGDQPLGGDPTRVDPTTNPTQGIVDQLVKDLAGSEVSDLLESSLTKWTGLDVVRVEVGFSSIGLHVEKKVVENLNWIGTTETTSRGFSANVRAEWKTPYAVSGQIAYLKKDFNDPAEEDIVDWNLKLVFRWFWRNLFGR